jgi:hypothetical protein
MVVNSQTTERRFILGLDLRNRNGFPEDVKSGILTRHDLLIDPKQLAVTN